MDDLIIVVIALMIGLVVMLASMQSGPPSVRRSRTRIGRWLDKKGRLP